MANPILTHARVPSSPVEGDILLRQFLDSTSTQQADGLLAEIMERCARPVVTGIIRRKLGPGSGSADVEDVTADVLARVLSRLLELRSKRDAEPIASLTAYVATAAHNRWHRFMREKFPARARLKNRLRYVTSSDARLALWTDHAGATVCGLRQWQGEARSGSAAERVRSIAGSPDVFTDEAFRGEHWAHLNEAALAAAAVAWSGGPILLDDLVAAIAAICGVPNERQSSEHDESDAAAVEATADPTPSVLAILTEREDLRRLWSEVQELPVRQRAALLLNLRGSDGQGVVGLLPFTGTATIRQIAGVLEIPPGELAAIWRDLPLDDQAIATRLGVTRQQVINLRKCARERLGRRLRSAAQAAGSTPRHSASSMVKQAPGSSAAAGLGQ